MKHLLWLLLWPVLAFSQVTPTIPTGTVLGNSTGFQSGPSAVPTGAVLNVLQQAVPVVCDGATDNSAALTALSTASASGNTIYFPPAPLACLTSTALVIKSGVTVWAYPGTVTLQMTSGNVANPALLSTSSTTGVLVHGLILDGAFTVSSVNACGVSTGPKCNNLVTSKDDKNITYENNVFQNSSGGGLAFTTAGTTGSSGIVVRDNQFLNIGNNWTASSTATDRKRALTLFCNSISGCSGGSNTLNTVSGNKFTTIGLDMIYLSNVTNANVENNRCENFANISQYTLTNNWPSCVGVTNGTSLTIVGNFGDYMLGNGIDVSGTTNLINIVGNLMQFSGGAGIMFGNGLNANISGNTVANNYQYSSNTHQGGITLDSHLANVSNVTVDDNVAVDTQGSPTQKYGISNSSGGGALSNIVIGSGNTFAGNITSALGPGLSYAPPPSGTVINASSLTSAPTAAPTTDAGNVGFTLMQSAVPFILANTCNISTTGALTLCTALPQIYNQNNVASALMYFPANTVELTGGVTGAIAGFYWVQMTTTQAGQVCLEGATAVLAGYTSGSPVQPATCTAPTHAANAVFTTGTAEITGPTINLTGNTLGVNGSLIYDFSGDAETTSGTTHTYKAKLSAAQMGQAPAPTTVGHYNSWIRVRNRGYAKAQYITTTGPASATLATMIDNQNANNATLDTTATKAVSISMTLLSAAASNMVLENYSFEVHPN